MDGYDARMWKTFLEKRWDDFLTHLQDAGEADPNGAAQDVMVALDEVIDDE